MVRHGTPSSAALFGETGAIIRNKDWSQTPLGPIEEWPQSLQTALSICLGSKQPMFVWWKTGDGLTIFYNDAYIPIAGAKHPDQIGADCWSTKGWAEMRPYLQSLVDQVFNEGTANWSDNMLLPLYRQEGFLEEGYFSFSYSPIIGEGGEVAGMYCATSETTRQVFGERRLRLLRNLGTGTALSSSHEVATHAAAQLAEDPRDVPFSLLYLVDPDGEEAVLAASSLIPPGSAASPTAVSLKAGAPPSVWPLGTLLTGGAMTLVRDLRTLLPRDLPTEPWSEPPDAAAILPIASPGQERPIGFLIVGLSPRLHVDRDYESFLKLVAGHVTTNLTNARAVEAERRRAQQLADLDRAKTAFFSNVSHEFRTPLTLMLGPLEEELRENPAASDRVRVAHRNSVRLLKLVNTLLDFSRIEAGRIQASYEPTDLAATTADLASVFRSAIEQAGVQLRIECPPLPDVVHVDREMWEKMVFNLLSNAFKFTFEGEIAVRLRWRGEHVELSVSDTGVGIPAEELTRIFDRFHRVRGTRSRTHEGTGIGLALVQELARLHGGDVRVESVEGRGTTFVVMVKTGTAHLPADRISAERTTLSTGLDAQSFVDEALQWLPNVAGRAVIDSSGSHESASRHDRSAVASARPRILLADDNADMRDYVNGLLSERWQVVTVADGAAALASVRQHKPALVLADVMMPGLDGFELLAALRADPATQGIPVVLLSARAGEEATLAGIVAGADDYLVKPFTARDLLTRVEAQLTRAQVREAVAESEQRLRAFVTATSDAVYRMSADWSEMHHLDGRAFIADTLDPSRHWLEKYIHPDDQPMVSAAIRRAIESKQPFELEHRVYRVDGSLGWTFSRAIPILGDAGEITEWIGTARDVTAREQDDEALRASEEQLREADRRKNEFLAMLAHELRNPLAPIRTGLELIRVAGNTPAAVERVRNMMERQIGHMVRLIDDLLDVSRITSGKIQLQREPTSLTSVIHSAIDANRAAMLAKGIGLELDLPRTVVSVDVDPTRFVQVVSNLLHNATKFTEPGGSVRVSAHLTEPARHRLPEVTISVLDTGIGIPTTLLPHVFELFTQGDGPSSQPGLGIGLALAKRLVEMQGGSIDARSAGAGRGSEFVIRMPLATKPARAHLDDAIRPALVNCRVVVIDDNQDAAEAMAMLVEALGGDCRAVFDGESGLREIRDHRPDVVLLDIGMPGIDGYETCRHIRKELGDHVLVVAVTGFGQEQDKERATQAGFDAHLTKPAEPAALEKILRRT